jgi:hypothetical protein
VVDAGLDSLSSSVCRCASKESNVLGEVMIGTLLGIVVSVSYTVSVVPLMLHMHTGSHAMKSPRYSDAIRPS